MPVRREDLDTTLYDQLKKQAQLAMSRERADHTLSATSLVHEAYLRLGSAFANRAHFYASAAEAMRRVLVDHARGRLAQKRGGGDEGDRRRGRRVELGDIAHLASTMDPSEILDLDEAISRLEKQYAEAAAVVRMRYFAGLGNEETAAALGVSISTVKREWDFAKAYLFRAISK